MYDFHMSKVTHHRSQRKTRGMEKTKKVTIATTRLDVSVLEKKKRAEECLDPDLSASPWPLSSSSALSEAL